MHVSTLSPARKAGAALGALALFAGAATTSSALVADDSNTNLDPNSVSQDVVRYEDTEFLTSMQTPDLPDWEPQVEAAGEVDEAPAVSTGSVWDRLADCESGDWQDGWPLPGTARWDYGLTFSHGDIFEGGVNFHPGTWDAYKDAGMPDHAGQATRAQQIMVAERVLADQGWGAWPVCSEMLGLR